MAAPHFAVTLFDDDRIQFDYGQDNTNITPNVGISGGNGVDYMVIPAEQVSLPSAALGFGAGGGVAIDVTDQSGLSAAEPFYEVRLGISSESPVSLLHGRSGRVRFGLPDEPLLVQWYRKLRQLLQDRYQL